MRDDLWSKLAAKANAYPFALQLEIGEAVLCNQFDQFAQLIQIERSFRASRRALLRLLWVATSSTVTRAALMSLLLLPVRLR